MEKYFLLKRNSRKLCIEYLQELEQNKRKSIEKRISLDQPLLLIEKTIKNNQETYSNLWTIQEGVEYLWTIHTKGRLMYDYTGVVMLVHKEGNIQTWEQYQKR